MKKARIYTGTGDNGTTSLIGGTRVPKDHIRVEAYGTIDELNAHLGLLSIQLDDNEAIATIDNIQNNLFTIGCSLANEDSTACTLPQSEITALEHIMDKIEAGLHPIHKFILPGGNEAAARANLCRTVCRRAERAIISLGKEVEINPILSIYINRLSDYLFLLQRQLIKGEEKIWEKHCK